MAIAKQLLTQVGADRLKQVHLVGHSAGCWAVYSALRTLSDRLPPSTQIQATYLDAFIPAKAPLGVVNHPFAESVLCDSPSYTRASNPGTIPTEDYYVTENDITDTLGEATSPKCTWAGAKGVVFVTGPRWTEHAGPVQFYADTVGNPDLPEAQGHGWKHSLAYNDRPKLELDPAILDFGTLRVGKSATKQYALRNSGTAWLHVTEFPFSPVLPSPIAPGGSWPVQLTFSPDQEGPITETLTIKSDGGDATLTITAVGLPDRYPIQLLVDGEGTLIPAPPSASAMAEQDFTVTAQPGVCFRISGWEVDGVRQDTAPTLTLSNVTAPHIVKAIFERKVLAWTVSAVGAEGSAAGIQSGPVECGGTTPAIVPPVPGDCWEFVQWVVNGTPSGNMIPLTISGVEEDLSIQAQFQERKFPVAAVVIGSGGSVEPVEPQLLGCGASLKLVAKPLPGFAVKGWRLNGTPAQTGGDQFTLTIAIPVPSQVEVEFIQIDVPPPVVSARYSPDCDCIKLVITAPPGRYIASDSTDLGTWNPSVTVDVPETGELEVPLSLDGSARFIRFLRTE